MHTDATHKDLSKALDCMSTPASARTHPASWAVVAALLLIVSAAAPVVTAVFVTAAAAVVAAVCYFPSAACTTQHLVGPLAGASLPQSPV